ncbi:MAG: T9SS type A sorting domain-containing protein [Ignavibacteriales bacterium]|nr:T9SS type A sorting domain-containing protein [Ignavibacteriales bacterium]
MKKILIPIFILFLLINSFASIGGEKEIPNAPYGVTTTWSGQMGGYLLPSEGTIKALFIFAQFKDDMYDTTNVGWTKGQGPANMNGWVDQTWSSTPTQGSMTHYFNEMSFNKLKFIGKTVSVITPQNRSWYLANNKKRFDIHKEIIQQLDADPTWDFAQFDNWDFDSTWKHINSPDGIVDMVFIIWRNIAHEWPTVPTDSVKIIMDKLELNRYGDLGYGGDISVDGGARTIKTGFWPNVPAKTPGGSGATMTDWFNADMFRFSIHEFAHYLLGGNEYHNGHAFWAMLSGYEIRSYMANSYERYRLGWCNLTPVTSSTQTITNATLPDFITTGIGYKIEINAATNQYFYIENHQRNSYWDNCSSDQNEKGLYIIRQDRASSSNGNTPNWMWLVPANGRYDWTVNKLTLASFYPDSLPVYKKGLANRANGYSETDMIPFSLRGYYEPNEMFFIEDPNTGGTIDYLARIGHGQDAFKIGYNEVFSPWSSPTSKKADGTQTGIGFKINTLISGTYSIDIYVNTAVNASPSKPINPKLSSSSGLNGPVKISWTPNESGESISLYEVSRKVPSISSNWVVLGTTTNSYYIDNAYIYAPGGGDFTPNYRVRVKDTQNLYSLYSDVVTVRAEGANKETASNEEKPSSFSLNQNYPNPFNPTTIISYQTPKAGRVTLKIYDVLGKVVATLVNEHKEEGKYIAEFNGSNLTSGIYFYELRTNEFVTMKKMLLVK